MHLDIKLNNKSELYAIKYKNVQTYDFIYHCIYCLSNTSELNPLSRQIRERDDIY